MSLLILTVRCMGFVLHYSWHHPIYKAQFHTSHLHLKKISRQRRDQWLPTEKSIQHHGRKSALISGSTGPDKPSQIWGVLLHSLPYPYSSTSLQDQLSTWVLPWPPPFSPTFSLV